MNLVELIRKHPGIAIFSIGAIAAGGTWSVFEKIRIAPMEFAIEQREFAIKERERIIEELKEKLHQRDEDLRYFLSQTSFSEKGDALSPQEKELYQEGTMLWLGGVYGDALEKLEQLISVRPDYVNAYIIRGRIYLENLKQYQNAVLEFKKGLEKDAHNKYLLYDLGLTYYYLGDLTLAIEWNQKALDQDPDFIIAIYNHGIYHVDYGEKYKDRSYYDKAIDLYQNVIARDREFATWAMFNLAALYARLAKQEDTKTIRDQYVKKAVELLDTYIGREGPESIMYVTDEKPLPYGEDLKTIYQDPNYKALIKKWKEHFRLQ